MNKEFIINDGCLEKYIGERYKKVHIHFSKIEYGDIEGELLYSNVESIKKGYVTYVINTSSEGDEQNNDGRIIRRAAIDNNVAIFTCLDTVKYLYNG